MKSISNISINWRYRYIVAILFFIALLGLFSLPAALGSNSTSNESNVSDGARVTGWVVNTADDPSTKVITINDLSAVGEYDFAAKNTDNAGNYINEAACAYKVRVTFPKSVNGTETKSFLDKLDLSIKYKTTSGGAAIEYTATGPSVVENTYTWDYIFEANNSAPWMFGAGVEGLHTHRLLFGLKETVSSFEFNNNINVYVEFEQLD